jgi:hypothetical protein
LQRTNRFFDVVRLRAEGENSADRLLNTIHFEAEVNHCGLYCNDPEFVVKVNTHEIGEDGGASQTAAGLGKMLVLGRDTKALAEIERATGKGKMVVECLEGPEVRSGPSQRTASGWKQIAEVELACDMASVVAAIDSQHLERLLWGLSARYSLIANAVPGAGADVYADGAQMPLGGMDKMQGRGEGAHLLEGGEGILADGRAEGLASAGPVVSISVSVAHAHIVVADADLVSACSDVAAGGDGSGGGAECEWVQLVMHGSWRAQLISRRVAEMELRVPDILLLSRGATTLRKDREVVLPMLMRACSSGLLVVCEP